MSHVCALPPRSSGRGHYVLFLGKTLYSLYPGDQIHTGEFCERSSKLRMMRGACYYSKKIKVENVTESAKIVTNVQAFRDCALYQWNVC